MQRFHVTKEEYELILRELRTVLAEDETVIFAYLHGSFLRQAKFGDIDIAVYLNVDEADLLSHELKLEEKLDGRVPFPVDVRLLNRAPLSFRYTVLKDGLRLADKNENLRVDFETATISQYFDFLPFRRRYLKDVLNIEL
ncbi:MAG: type VII toxin-antitoxin system MntA family adenylyltransferase antitoxin [Bacillota bacterium]